MNFVLFLIALILVLVFTPIGLVFTIIKSCIFWNRGILKKYFFSLAISLDQFGNVAMQGFFNICMVSNKSKHKFGNPDETISSVLGKNQKANTLIYPGKRLVALLDALDKNHSLKSIEQ